jgi:outer membrane protein OmpA-like peptidoglycan-associated protein
MSRFRALGLALAFHLVALSAVGLTAAPAEAQSISPGRLTLGGMDLHLFRPAMDSKGYLSVNGTDILGHLDISFGLIVDGGFGLLPYDSFVNDQTVSSADAERCGSGFLCGRLVNYLFTGTLHANLGLFNIMEIGLQVPLAFSAGDNRTIPGVFNDFLTGASAGRGADYQGLAGIVIHAKARILRAERNGGFGLGVGLQFEIESPGRAPSSATTPWVSGPLGFIFEPSIGDRDGDGYRDDVDRCPDRARGLRQLRRPGRLPRARQRPRRHPRRRRPVPAHPEDRDGEADTDGCPDRDNNDRDGDGILDNVDQCPDDPEDRDGFEDEDGCPDPDNDQDQILDRDDLCPNDPEDRDDFEDEDGCPDPDNDHDRIPDVRDRCVMEPETYNGTEDEDGCPDQGIAVLEENNIRILQAINFETDSAQIRPESLPIVEAVAATLRGNPQLSLVQVQGHADERGDDDHNLQLTRDRAASVVRALVERGVERNRLQSAGYGERCPIDPRPRNPEAWARNRRVSSVRAIKRPRPGSTTRSTRASWSASS